MNSKAYLVLMGSIMLLVGTIFKTSLYYIDIILNAFAFPMFLFLFVFTIWNKKLKAVDINQKVYEGSIFVYIIYTISLSLSIFALNGIIFLAVYLLYKNSDKKYFSKVCTEEKSYLDFFKINKKLLKIKVLIAIWVLYYISFSIIVFQFNGLNFKPEFA